MNKKCNIHHIVLGIFFLVLSLGQLQRIQVSSSVAVYISDLILSGWILGTLGYSAKFRSFLASVFTKNLLTLNLNIWHWLIFGLIVGLARQPDHLILFLYFSRIFMYLLAGVEIFYLVKTKVLTRQVITWGLFTFATYILYFGILQYIFIPDTRMLFFLGWDDHYYRLISTLFDPGFTGIILVMYFFLLQFLSRKPRLQIFWPILSMITLSGILLTYSRASYLALGIGLIIGALFSPKRKTLAIYLIIFLLAIPFLPRPGGEGVKLERTSTVIARTEGYTQSFTNFQPLDWAIGRGLFSERHVADPQYATVNHANTASNWLLSTITDTGLIGLALFAIGLWRIQKHFFKQNIWLFAMSAAFLTHGLFNATLFYPFALFFLIISSIVIIDR